jgi:hypothetical protein
VSKGAPRRISRSPRRPHRAGNSEESTMVTHARVVFVNSHNHLTDAAGHDCRYRTANGEALLPGYWYAVSWPDDIDEPLFDAKARYAGPFDSEPAARQAVAAPALRARTGGAVAMAELATSDASFFPDWHCDR